MKKNYDIALDHILRHEGGFAIRNTEGGGAVNRGVTFSTFKAWRAKTSPFEVVDFDDLKNMTDDEAKAIYADLYMKPVMFDTLPSGVDYVALDAAVNGGPTGSIRILQEALGHKVDGKMTLKTRWGAKMRDPVTLINKMCDNRIATYKTFSRFNAPFKEGATKTWGDIWVARINVVRSRAVAMIQGEKNA